MKKTYEVPRHRYQTILFLILSVMFLFLWIHPHIAMAEGCTVEVRFGDAFAAAYPDGAGNAVKVELFQVGGYSSEDDQFFMFEAFRDTAMNFMAQDADVDQAIEQMNAHFAGNTSPDATETASGSSVRFSGLNAGVYFGRLSPDGTVPSDFGMSSFFVMVNTELVFDAKWTLVTRADVQKIWKDDEFGGDGNRDKARPYGVRVQLFTEDAQGNLKAYEPEAGKIVTADLNEKNDWKASQGNLPKYSSGKERSYDTEIKYVWKEIACLNQDGTVRNHSEVPYTIGDPDASTAEEARPTNVWKTEITNTHEPERTKRLVEKVWVDKENQWKTPNTITVTLTGTAGGKVVFSEDKILSASNDWKAEIDNLFVFEKGVRISYSWSEEDVEDYVLTIKEPDAGREETSATVLTNTHEPEFTSATIKKVWDDAEDQDGLRQKWIDSGKDIVVRLLKNGENTDQTVKLNAGNGWTATITKLDKYTEGKPNTYTWREETVPDGYTVTGYDANGTVTSVTNTHEPETVSLTVLKEWNDEDNRDGIRPEEIQVTLSTGDTYTLNEANGWKVTVKDLPRFKSGKEISYAWTEVKTAGYEGSTPVLDPDKSTDVTKVSVITNTHVPEKVSVGVRKVWDDNNNQDGVQPANVAVQLLGNDVNIGEAVTLSESNQWKHVWTDLYKYENGEEIEYRVEEIPVPAGYSPVYTMDPDNKTEDIGLLITNPHTPDTTTFTVTKRWADKNDQDGIRPESVTVQLLQNGAVYDSITLPQNNRWAYTWSGLPCKADGKDLTYSVQEVQTDELEAYTTANTNVTDNSTTIVNTHEPETINIPAVKKWADDDDRDALRPASIVVRLLADGKEVRNATLAAPDWAVEWKGLPKYKSKGKAIVYTVEEDAVTGYTGTVTGDAQTGFTVTNTYTPETIDIPVEKVWDDNDDQDGDRPGSVTVQLYAGNTAVGAPVTLSSANNWKYTWTGLPVNEGGTPISYNVEETAVSNYTPAVTGSAQDGFTITNTHTPGKTRISVRKVWDDANDQDGIRPAGIQVQLYADGKALGKSIALNAGNKWRYTWKNLDQKAEGEDIAYTVLETSAPTGYTSAVTGTAENGFVVTNTHTPADTQISVSKTWADNNDADGLRPDSISVQLLADGKASGKPVALNEDNDWSHTWTGLKVKNANGDTITYTVEEPDVPDGYTATVSGSAARGFTIRNTHTPDTGSLRITKAVTVNGAATTGTRADGTYSFAITGPDDYNETVTISIVSGAANRTVVNDLKPGTYTVTETVPRGMRLVGQNGIRLEVTANNTADIPTAAFTNNLLPDDEGQNPPGGGGGTPPTTPQTERQTEPQTGENRREPEYTTINGQKNWVDESNAHNTRPSSITVRLFADGVEVSSSPTWTGTSGNTWTYTFGQLPLTNDNGDTITYTVREDAVPGYETTVNGTVIINRLIPHTPREYISLNGVKTWADNANESGTRPNYITVRLYRNGTVVQERTVTAATGWTYSFENLPLDDGYGNDYSYEIREDGVPGYYARMDGNNITNSRIPDVPNRRTSTPPPPFEERTEEELEDLLDLFDYDTPLWGGLFGTGDEIPVYPFVFGGIGMTAILILIIFGRKKKESGVNG